MSAEVHFQFLDYFFFVILFIVTLIITLYFTFKLKAQQSIDEYCFGNRKIGVWPVAFSLLATNISGSTLIGQSMEVYAYGLHNLVFSVSELLRGIVVPIIFLPVFYELQVKSSFTYLELRFDKSVKLIASMLYVITGFLIIPLTIYVPALALQEVSGINFYVICLVSGGICVWYTSIGGFRAVVWTDFFQFILIMLSTIVIFAVGLKSTGGFSNVWKALERGGRLDIVRTVPSLEVRGSLWAYLFSSSLITTYNLGLTQSSIQRYMSLPTLGKAQLICCIQTFTFEVVLLLQLAIGAIIYATYEDCDPMKAGYVKKIDEIFPYFVQQKAAFFPGFNGIFLAGIFSAGLSTTSSLLNTISGTIYIDFLSNWRMSAQEGSASRIMKLITVVVGVIGVSLIAVIQQLGTIFAITTQCFTISTVGIFGLFCSGMFFKNINCKGAKCGVFVSVLIVMILIGGTFTKPPDPVLPLRTDGCDFLNSPSFSNFSMSTSTNISYEKLPWIFRINFHFFCIIGLIFNIAVGCVVSLLTGGNKVKDQRLLVKFLRKNVTVPVKEDTLLPTL